MKILPLLTAFIGLVLSVSCLANKESIKADVPGATDHPLVGRFTGSLLVGYRTMDWEETLLPMSAKASYADSQYTLQDPLTVAGKVTRLFYLSPLGKSPLEVFRNHEQALKGAGLKVVSSCEKDCTNLWMALFLQPRVTAGVKWTEGQIIDATSSHALQMGGASAMMNKGYTNARMLYGTLAHGGRTVHVLLSVSSAAGVPQTNRAGTYLEIVEPKAMPTGQVTVDTKAIDAKELQASLTAEGKVALYGIFFDTGKAELKPESEAQLAQMAGLLNGSSALKVFLVGHTDNVGSVEANLALSLRRAKAVAEALASRYKVDPNRLDARGVANLTPLASNEAEAGRSKNRRVELVAQ